MAQMMKRADRVDEFRELMNRPKFVQNLSKISPRHLHADRIVRMAMTTLQRQPDLLKCTAQSVLGCIITASQIGLEIDATSAQAYMVPFKDNERGVTVATLIPGYRGLMALAHRVEKIISVEARVVREGDEFDYQDEPPSVMHKRDLDGDPDAPMTYVYAVAVVATPNGGQYRQYEVLSKKQVDAIRAKSRGKNSTAWVNHYLEMAKKSAVRRLCKYLPSSFELSSAVTLDEQADAGIDQDLIDVPMIDGDSGNGQDQATANELPSNPADLPDGGSSSDPEGTLTDSSPVDA